MPEIKKLNELGELSQTGKRTSVKLLLESLKDGEGAVYPAKAYGNLRRYEKDGFSIRWVGEKKESVVIFRTPAEKKKKD